jgi:hypothetical protein
LSLGGLGLTARQVHRPMPGWKDMNGRVEIIGASTAMTLEHAQALIVA